MPSPPGPTEQLADYLSNPFLVLELRPDCTREEVEHRGARLLALLDARARGSDRYPTPLGPRPRTKESVRAALAELRDPDRRLVHEWWAKGFLPDPEPKTGEP